MHSGNQIRDLRDTCRSNKALQYLDAPCAGARIGITEYWGKPAFTEEIMRIFFWH